MILLLWLLLNFYWYENEGQIVLKAPPSLNFVNP